MTRSESPTPGRFPALGSGPGTALLWAGSRLALIVMLYAQPKVWSDVGYYFANVDALRQTWLARTLVEYPTPVVWLLRVPHMVSGSDPAVYLAAFVTLMVLFDAVLTGWLWARGRDVRSSAAVYWMLFSFLIGPLIFSRFDLVTAVFAGGALLLVSRFPAVSGALVAAGAALKLWPALLITALWGERRRRLATWVGFALTGLTLLVASLLKGGLARLLSPLAWQSGRGLQIESVLATPAMLNLALRPGHDEIHFSDYKAFEIFGAGVPTMLMVASAATVAGGLAILALGTRAWLSRGHDLRSAALIMVAVVGIMIVTNKTLSPQYVIWLGAPLAVLTLVGGGHRTGDRWLLGLGLVLALCTQVIFPFTYKWIVDVGPGVGRTLATLLLTVRNAGLVGFTVLAYVLAWSSLGRPHPSPEPLDASTVTAS
ncbi:glycosyltransferase 87 family protein [Raineyella fluvialis]|uniref:glycosyltransferase 87 family protein n=1 Tax=Raineyella fluvialis TaxID=2662261 RepID=UPI00188E7004|nr:glycosyltransferase 87 family protein [Raineyella fluvialis]